MRSLRVALIGFGPIGRAVAREILATSDLRLVGVVDPAPDLAGRPVAELLDDPSAGRLRVLDSLDRLPDRVDVAAHLSASRFPAAAAQIAALVERRLRVVTTCEEMIAARWRWPRRAGKLDAAARAAGVPVVATGVNPGFVMDLVPSAMANVMVSVRSVRVTRRVDTSRRRKALQAKTGAGITRAEFRARAAEGTVGHVGLKDSLVFLMNHLPLHGQVGDEKLTAVIQRKTGKRIPRGHVAGVHQIVRARDAAGKIVATLDLTMVHGLEDPYDEIRIAGDPPVVLRFEGGLQGDRATVGAVLAALRWVEDAPPGLG